MGLFDKKTIAEKERDAAIKAVKQDARQDRKDARQDARDDKQDARQAARDVKKDARDFAQEARQDARQAKRDELRDIRQSDLEGEAKRDAKSDVREEKREAVRDTNDDKKDTVTGAREARSDSIDAIKDTKRTALDDIREREIDDLAALHAIDTNLALELLALSYVSEVQDAAAFAGSVEVQNSLDPTAGPCLLRGAIVRGAVAITGKSFKSDTECFVARSENNDIVVAFRGSETDFLDKEGAIKDWALTDLRANRIPYPPAPRSWPDQRWVHAGFWQAYEVVRNRLLAEVTRQVTHDPPSRRIYVTGFSLGGALALLAALDIADALPETAVELFTFAAPRVGDASLNKLVTERVHQSTLVAFRGDPVVHLPPLGPNFPVTFKQPLGVDLAGIHVGLGNPIPQVAQQYRTADRLVYIDKHGAVRDRFPTAQVALHFLDHTFSRYQTALKGLVS